MPAHHAGYHHRRLVRHHDDVSGREPEAEHPPRDQRHGYKPHSHTARMGEGRRTHLGRRPAAAARDGLRCAAQPVILSAVGLARCIDLGAGHSRRQQYARNHHGMRRADGRHTQLHDRRRRHVGRCRGTLRGQGVRHRLRDTPQTLPRRLVARGPDHTLQLHTPQGRGYAQGEGRRQRRTDIRPLHYRAAPHGGHTPPERHICLGRKRGDVVGRRRRDQGYPARAAPYTCGRG